MESSNFAQNQGSTDATDSMNAGSASGTNPSGATNDVGEQTSGLADRARGAFGSAGEKLGEVGSTVRDRAGMAKESLASALETGAEKLRARAGDGSLAGATGLGGSVAITDDRMAQVTTKVAGGMDAASEWLRDADLNNLKSAVETQIKEHPGRTLLVAVGVGYLLGKALRN